MTSGSELALMRVNERVGGPTDCLLGLFAGIQGRHSSIRRIVVFNSATQGSETAAPEFTNEANCPAVMGSKDRKNGSTAARQTESGARASESLAHSVLPPPAASVTGDPRSSASRDRRPRWFGRRRCRFPGCRQSPWQYHRRIPVGPVPAITKDRQERERRQTPQRILHGGPGPKIIVGRMIVQFEPLSRTSASACRFDSA